MMYTNVKYRIKSIKRLFRFNYATALVGIIFTTTINAQGVLEEVIVTAQKRTQNIQDVPVSVATLSDENLNAVLSSGVDILGLSARVPSLYIETSNGRVAPRFYIRGLGNTVFDANASQPVSVVYDDVVLENVSAKAFPIFDIATTEVLRGPQGTLFGRNTPAGVVKFESVRPSQETKGFVEVGFGRFGQERVDAAVGGALSDTVSARISFLHRGLDDFIDQLSVGQEQGDAAGGYDETAARLQFLWQPSEATDVLLNVGIQDLENSGGTFRAGIFQEGVGFVGTDRESTSQDTLATAGQVLEQYYGTLRIDHNINDNYTFTSITGYREISENQNQGDVDGGSLTGPVFPGSIPFFRDVLGFGNDIALETGDSVTEHEQFTQEFRIASNFDGPLNWQAGAYYFTEDVTIDAINSLSFAAFFGGFPLPTPPLIAQQFQQTDAFAVFGSIEYDISDRLRFQGGLRYSEDEKDYSVVNTPASFFNPGTVDFADTDDSEVTGDLSLYYTVDENVSVYGRLSRGYRASSILSRQSIPDVGEAETIHSIEAGLKSTLLNNSLRFNLTGYVYELSDQQLAVVGGGANTVGLVNADSTDGFGFESDIEYAPSNNVLLTFGASYNDTEINDPDLSIEACAAGCTVLDPENPNPSGFNPQFFIDGNSLPNAPEWIFNATLRLSKEVSNGGEIYFLTDWFYRSEINPFLYESVEFEFDSRIEGGIRVGYIAPSDKWEIAAYARNITDELEPIAALDFFNGLNADGSSFFSGSQNEPRTWGVTAKYNF